MTWCPPALTLIWGQYFAPDSDDDAKIVTLTTAALDGGLITKRAAVRKVARTFDIENVDAFLETLEDEAAENMKRQQEMIGAGEGAMHKMLLEDDGGDEPPAPPPKKAKKPPPKTTE